jgi:hypothetical protein
MAFDNHIGTVYLYEIEGIGLTPAARGRCGAGLYKDCRLALDSVSHRCVTAVADVHVSGQQDIHASGDSCHGHTGAADELAFRVLLMQVEGMVGDEHAGCRFGPAQLLFNATHLPFAYAAAAEWDEAGGAHPHHSQITVGPKRLEVGRDVPLV